MFQAEGGNGYPMGADPRLVNLYNCTDMDALADMEENHTSQLVQDIRAMYRAGFKLKAWMKAVLDNNDEKNKVFYNISEKRIEWQSHTRTEIESKYNFFYRQRVGRFVESSDELEKNKGLLVDWLIDEQSKPFLLIRGTVGSGKTTSMNAVLDVIRDYKIETVNNYRDKKGLITIVCIDSRTLFEEIGANVAAHDKYMKFDVLAIDDFGQEPREYVDHGNKKNPLERLLSERQCRSLKTILTCNLDNEGLKNYGDRLYDRLKLSAKMVKYEHPSYR